MAHIQQGNRLMAGAGRVDVVGGGTESVTITGSGFGTGPTVVLFHRMDGTPTSSVNNGDPEIGDWTDGSSPSPTYETFDGRVWLTSGSFGSTIGLRQKITTFSSAHKIRVAFRVGVPTGYEWPNSASPTDGPLGHGSIAKPLWLGNSGYTEYGTGTDTVADLVVGSMIGATCDVVGNSIVLASGKRGFLAAAKANLMVPGVQALFSYYQAPVDGDIYNTSGGTHRFASVSGAQVANVSVLCSPYGTQGTPYTLTVTGYDSVLVPGWFGNDSGNENRIVIADVYVATGENAGKCVVLHNESTLAASTECFIVPHSSWSDTSITTVDLHGREKLSYYTVMDGTGASLGSGATGY